MARLILTVVFLIFASRAEAENRTDFLASLEEKIENKAAEYATYFAEWLEGVNDRHLGKSALGKMLDYDSIKPRLNDITEARGMKKLSMALLPIIFHVGATSTWLVLTGLLAAKAVAIGIILLVFKIAVSSAKVASFFTAWKHNHHEHGHSWTPHYEHHGHYRSFDVGTHSDIPYLSYNTDWSTDVSNEYKSSSYYPSSYSEIELGKDKIDKNHGT